MWTLIKNTVQAAWTILNFTRVALANIVLLVLLGIGVGVWLWSPQMQVEPKSLLYMNLTGNVVEQSHLAGREAALTAAMGEPTGETLLSDVVLSLKWAADDPSIDGVYMRVDDLNRVGLAALREIGSAMMAFKQSGKSITVWSSSFTQQQYSIAAHATEVFLHPMGQVALKGLSSNRLYWGQTLKDAGVNVHVFKAGDYKTFPEVFVRTGPTEESRQADLFWMKDAWAQWTDSIQTARGLMPGAIDRLIEQLPERLQEAGGDAGALALSNNLVDALRTDDEVNDLLLERQGGRLGVDRLRKIDYVDYVMVKGSEQMPGGKGVAVVTLEGDIRDGKSGSEHVGARTAIRWIRQAKQDPNVGALLVRVDSPGGSAVASEMIRRELELVKKSGMPVVVSMGDYAASGGYWLSLAADRIYADPMTVTGSIGVFGMLPTFEKTLDKFSVGTGGVSTTWLAGAESLTQEMDPRYARMMELTIERTYRDFIRLVAESRKLSEATVRPLAQGRVYTGRQAAQYGLVDALGGLDEAMAEARRLAKLDDKAPIYWFEDHDAGWFLKLMSRIPVISTWLPEPMREPIREAERLSYFLKIPGQSMAHCLCSVR